MMTNTKLERVVNLFEFLKAYHMIKSPVVRELQKEEWVEEVSKWPVDEAITSYLDKEILEGGLLFTITKSSKDETLFNHFYTLYGKLKKEPEAIELVFGDGNLDQEGTYRLDHPFLLQTVNLEFDESIPAFHVRLADKGPELYEHFLGFAEGADESAVVELIKNFQAKPVSPLQVSARKHFMKQVAKVLSDTYEVQDDGDKIVLEGDKGRVEHRPTLFLRKRQLGFQTTIDQILEDLYMRKDVPPFIADIVGSGDVARKGQKSKEVLKKLALDVNGLDQKVLFTKPANSEQLLVAKHLERNEAVLVQGPPGTGKTHTIANMIGHLLAEGKSVLVTSYSEKALAVVKEKVTPELQSLCISLLGDAESRKELEISLEDIHSKRASLERSQLTRRVTTHEKNREACLRALDKLKADLKAIKLGEYTPIKVAGKMYKPVEAAKYVDKYRDPSAWLPGPVRHGALLPLNEENIKLLYEMKTTLKEEDAIICDWGVAQEELMKPEAFSELVEAEKKFKKLKKPDWMRYFKSGEGVADREELQNAIVDLRLVTEQIHSDSPWQLEVLEAGKDDKAKEQWRSLAINIKEIYQLNLTYADELMNYEPQVLGLDDKIKPLDVYSQINQKLQDAGKLSKMTLLLNPHMKTVIAASRINGRCPETMQEFETLIHYMILKEKRTQLKLRWDRQMVPLGAKKTEEMGESFELGCQKYSDAILKGLEWYKKKWLPLVKKLGDYGLDVQSLSELNDFETAETGEVAYIKDVLTDKLIEVLEYKAYELEEEEVAKTKIAMQKHVADYSSHNKSEILIALKYALKNNNTKAYTTAYEQIIEAKNKSEAIEKQKELLDKLAFAAPSWAEYLKEGVKEKEEVIVPEQIEEAWLCRQFTEIIAKRNERTITDVKHEMTEVEKRLLAHTRALALDKAWLHKLVDFDANRSEVQAIEGWKQLIIKIGAGKGKQAEMLKAEARKLMPKCQKAVPVWIMPLNKVAEHFDPRENKFDVVIIDEASQADMMALVALYLGKQVLIVGDHEQVSPLAVGERIEDMERLVKTYLTDIPHNYLYSGRFSIYDLAGLSGYQPVRLKEHFRCVPELIGYSNQLAYKGQIEPLREGGDKGIGAPIQLIHVEGAVEEGQVNEKEAEAIANQIVECCKQKAYDGKSFGVISLKGDKQAAYIDSLLQKEMSVTTYEKRNILCGNPSHFQGDERDIIFISMVDAPTENGPMRLMTYGTDNLYKKRYNVAMSRGKDQVWIMHSFNQEEHLKEEDIRKELFAYCENIGKESKQTEKLYEEPLPEFEAFIKEKLEEKGFKVEGHTSSGHILTGLIVSKNNHKVRVVCDSEKWQEEMELDEEMSKQAVLERIGWQFIYLSATHFYTDEKRSLKDLVEQLEEKGLV